MDMIVNSQQIVSLRKSKAWSQQHLAEVSGLSLRTVQRIENSGSGAPDSIKGIALALGLVPADLMRPKSSELDEPEQNDPVASQPKSKHLLFTISALVVIVALGTSLWFSIGSNDGRNADEKSVEVFLSQTDIAQHQIIWDAGLSWIKLIDAGEYDSGWQKSDAIVQRQLTLEQWQQVVQPVREPLGNVLNRNITSIETLSSMSGLPDGEYAVVTINTRFENKIASVETITMSKTSGEWRAIGYFIR